jgi:hypothetical protein
MSFKTDSCAVVKINLVLAAYGAAAGSAGAHKMAMEKR